MVARQPWLLIPAAALAVAGLAIGFAQITGQPADTVLFSGQDAFGSLIKQGTAVSLSTLAFLLLFKGLAWSISLGNFRGGPTFPALFIGAAAGLLAAHLPGFSETPAVAVLMAAAAVSILELPLSATIITLLLTSKAGIATAPLIIVAVVVAYLTIKTLSVTRAPAAPTPPATEPQPAVSSRPGPASEGPRVTPDPVQRAEWSRAAIFGQIRAYRGIVPTSRVTRRRGQSATNSAAQCQRAWCAIWSRTAVTASVARGPARGRPRPR